MYPIQPFLVKHWILAEEEKGLTADSLYVDWEDRTIRPIGHKNGLGRWRWALLADQHAAAVSWHVKKVIVDTDLAGEAQDSA